jgi:hypothetical protein
MKKEAQSLDRIAQSTWVLSLKDVEHQIMEIDFGVE